MFNDESLNICESTILDITKIFSYCVFGENEEQGSFMSRLINLNDKKLEQILNKSKDSDIITNYIYESIYYMTYSYDIDYIDYILEAKILCIIRNPEVNDEYVKALVLAKNLLLKGFYNHNLDYFVTVSTTNVSSDLRLIVQGEFQSLLYKK